MVENGHVITHSLIAGWATYERLTPGGRLGNSQYRSVSLRLRVQNQRKKWNFPINFRTMRKLSDLYSGIFQNY